MIVGMVELRTPTSMRIKVTRHFTQAREISPFRLASLMEERNAYDNQRSLKPFIYSYTRLNPYEEDSLFVLKMPADKLGMRLLNNEFEKLDYLLQLENLSVPRPLTRIEKEYNGKASTSFVLEVKEGVSLHQLIRNSEPNASLLEHVESALLESAFLLSEIHKLNIAHGNLLPSNIFITREGVFIEGFELSMFGEEFFKTHSNLITELDVLLDSVKYLLERKFKKNMEDYIKRVRGTILPIYLNTFSNSIYI